MLMRGEETMRDATPDDASGQLAIVADASAPVIEATAAPAPVAALA
jgi:hypothetical protein